MKEFLDPAYDEHEIAQSHGLHVEEVDSYGLPARLINESNLIKINRDLPELEKKALIIHEIIHYVTDNYIACKTLSESFSVPGLDSTILDVYHKEKIEAEKRHKQFLNDLEANLEDDDGASGSEIEVADAMSEKFKETKANWLLLENAFSELHTWTATERFYEARIRESKSWEDIEAIRFCNRQIKIQASSALKVIRRNVDNDRRLIKALEFSHATMSKENISPFSHMKIKKDKQLDKLKAIFKELEMNYREEEFRWLNSLEISSEREKIALETHESMSAPQWFIKSRRAYQIEGGVSFDKMFRFKPNMPEIADMVQKRTKEYFQKRKSISPVNVDMDSSCIFLSTGFEEIESQSFKISDSSIIFSMRIVKGMFPSAIVIRDILGIIINVMDISHWKEVGIKYIQSFSATESNVLEFQKSLFFVNAYSESSLDIPASDVQHWDTSMNFNYKNMHIDQFLSLQIPERLFTLSTDFRTRDYNKYGMEIWEFFLECHGLFIEDFKKSRELILSDFLD